MNKLHSDSTYMFKHAHEALAILVTMPGDIRERLRHAGEELIQIPEIVVPESARDDFIQIKKYLTEYKASESIAPNMFDSDVHATMTKRRTKTAIPMAKKILNFYFKYEAEINAG